MFSTSRGAQHALNHDTKTCGRLAPDTIPENTLIIPKHLSQRTAVKTVYCACH